MVFSSPVFLFVFLPITLLLVALAGRRPVQNAVLLVASLLFYAWGEGVYVLLMLSSILVNYVFGLAIAAFHRRKFLLVIAVVLNLSALIWAKYLDLLVEAFNAGLDGIGMPLLVVDPVHLPIGVSFFIFQGISYVVDVYRGHAEAQQRPGAVALYISLFPQLIAGPIVRYKDIAQQISGRVMDVPLIASGIRRFIVGLAKKVLIADQVALIADPIFELPSSAISTSVAWLAIVAYAVQIYFDFSGYSDMAIGLGRMFGFTFLENFNRPYIARSIREFWRRWHISLSTWFRDYLYIPLGGNRKSGARTYFNLLVVFFLTGLWHGASWNFVVWGLIHGLFMVLERVGWLRVLDRLPAVFGHVYTLAIVLFAWAFFRITDITQAYRFFLDLIGLGIHADHPLQPGYYLTPVTLIALLLGVAGSLNIHETIIRRLSFPFSGVARTAGLIALLFLTLMFVATSTYSPFIYFRF